jgi:F0F1-type ATP synthase epsilon subunit
MVAILTKLKVRIRTSEDTIWEGDANAVTSKNSDGVFDILPEHAQMVTLIENNQIIMHTDEGDKNFIYKEAVLHVHDNIVSVYVAD